MLECAKKAWTTGKDDKGYPTYLPGKKFLQVSTDEVYGSLTKDFDVPQPLHIEDENVRRVVKGRTKIQTYGRTFFTEETPLDPRSPYSSSKTGADLIFSKGVNCLFTGKVIMCEIGFMSKIMPKPSTWYWPAAVLGKYTI